MKALSRWLAGSVAATFALGPGVLPALAQETWGTALSFDGVNNAVLVSGMASFPASAFTVECWMRAADSSPPGALVSYCASAGHDALLLRSGPGLQVTVNAATTESGVSANDGQWHHLAVTWVSAGGALRVYRDGALAFDQDGVAAGSTLPAGGSFVLGQRQTLPGGGFESGAAFRGDLDDVRIWNVARTAPEIQSTMRQPLCGEEAGLVSYWSLDEGCGQLAGNACGSAVDGTLVNGPAWTTAAAPLRMLYFTGMQRPSAQQWTFRFQDAGTGATNYALEFLPALATAPVWTDLAAVNLVPAGDGVFQADLTQAAGDQGYYRLRGLRSVRVNLSATSAEFEEGAGTQFITLMFERPFVGTVGYRLGGPDTNSVAALSGTVAVHGTRAQIPLAVRDDTDLGALKYLTLTLEPGSGYQVGPSGRLTVTLSENDAEWQGSLWIPTGLASEATPPVGGTPVTVPLNMGAAIDFVLRIQRSEAGHQATFRSEAFGFFPTNEVPAQIACGADHFGVTVTNILMAESCTGLDAPLDLALELTARNGLTNQRVTGTQIQGLATLTQQVVGHPHLRTTNAARFELRQPASRPSGHEVGLQP